MRKINKILSGVAAANIAFGSLASYVAFAEAKYTVSSVSAAKTNPETMAEDKTLADYQSNMEGVSLTGKDGKYQATLDTDEMKSYSSTGGSGMWFALSVTLDKEYDINELAKINGVEVEDARDGWAFAGATKPSEDATSSKYLVLWIDGSNERDITISDLGITITVKHQSTIDAEKAELEAAKTTLKDLISTAESKGYDGKSVEDAGLLNEFNDALSEANTAYAGGTLEDVKGATTRLDNAIKAIEKYLEDSASDAEKAKVDKVKAEIQAILDKTSYTEDDLFPGVWEEYDAAVKEAEEAVDNDELTLEEANRIKEALSSAVANADADAPGKAEVNEAKKTLKETLDGVKYTQDQVGAELWNDLQEAITKANEVMDNKGATLEEVTAAQGTLSAAIDAIDDIVNNSVTLTDTTTGISISGAGIMAEHKFYVSSSTNEDNNAYEFSFALKDSEDKNLSIDDIEASAVKIKVPLTKNFDSVTKVYLYQVSGSKYTAVSSSDMYINDGVLTITSNATSGNYAMSRVALKSDGTVDDSNTGEIETDTVTDSKSQVTLTSDSIDFTNAKLTATIKEDSTSQISVKINVTTKDDGAFSFKGGSAQASVPLTTNTLKNLSKVYVYQVKNDKYTAISSNVAYGRALFDITSNGDFVISAVALNLNEDGTLADSDISTPLFGFVADGEYSKEDFAEVISKNADCDIVITSTGPTGMVEFFFKAGTMELKEGAKYDFSTKFIRDYNSLGEYANDAIKKDSFVMYIDYAYEGDLPAEAQIRMSVGSSYAGQKLYYSQVLSNKIVLVQTVTVDEQGFVTVTQDHCSDYVLTTENIADTNTGTGTGAGTGTGENNKPSTGGDTTPPPTIGDPPEATKPGDNNGGNSGSGSTGGNVNVPDDYVPDPSNPDNADNPNTGVNDVSKPLSIAAFASAFAGAIAVYKKRKSNK